MKILIITLFTLMFYSLTAGAETFTYAYMPTKDHGFNLELQQLTQHFEDKNFDRLSLFSSGNIPLLHVDEVLSSSDNQSQIFIKMGLIAPTELQNKITEFKSSTNTFYVYHTDAASIAFFNLSELEVKQLVTGLGSQSVVYKTFSQFFLGEAFADEVYCSRNKPTNSYKSLEGISNSIENSVLYKRIGECAVSALRSAGKQFEDTADFFKKMVSNPTALWEDVKQSYVALKSFALNFSSELQSFYRTMTHLSLDEKLEIACTLTGQIGAGALMSLTGAGVALGGAKLVASIIPKLARMKSMMQNFQRFKIPNKTAMETLSCGI